MFIIISSLQYYRHWYIKRTHFTGRCEWTSCVIRLALSDSRYIVTWSDVCPWHNVQTRCWLSKHSCPGLQYILTCACIDIGWVFITLRPRQNGHYLPDDIFKCMILNENIWILNKMLPKFVPQYTINNISSSSSSLVRSGVDLSQMYSIKVHSNVITQWIMFLI